MAKKTDDQRLDLPSLELKCLQALWALREATVREIRSRLPPERALAYTTVMTIMDRLARKSVVGRAKRGRAFVYRPLVTEGAILEQAVARLVRDYFQGSRQQFLRYLGEARAARAPSLREEAGRPAPEAPETAPLAVRTGPGKTIDPSLL